MKSQAYLLVVALAVLFAFDIHAQAPAVVVREFKDLLMDIPSKEFLKLRGNTKGETAMAMSKDITTKELNKESTFRIKVGKVDSWPYPSEGITGWRVHCVDEKVRQGSLTITVSAWAYVRTDPDGVLAKTRPGKEIIVTGKLTRADITAVEEPVLNIDVAVTSIKQGK